MHAGLPALHNGTDVATLVLATSEAPVVRLCLFGHANVVNLAIHALDALAPKLGLHGPAAMPSRWAVPGSPATSSSTIDFFTSKSRASTNVATGNARTDHLYLCLTRTWSDATKNLAGYLTTSTRRF